MGQILRLPTGYTPEANVPVERPVPKKDAARLLGVTTRTIDRWVERGCRMRNLPPMPRDTTETYGCWLYAGCHRRFYITRVRQWLDGDL